MSSRIAEVAVPPRCNEMIRAGALVAINTSGGKDSQAMTILLARIVPRDQIVAVHAPLGEVDWPGTIEHIEATLPAGVPLIFTPVASGKTLLERVEERGLWPSNSARWCTSDYKAGPIQRELRPLSEDPSALRRDGSSTPWACARRKARRALGRRRGGRNDRMSVASREVFDWLPVFDFSTEDVFRVIRHAGQSPHRAYAAGMSTAELQLLHPGVPRRSAPRSGASSRTSTRNTCNSNGESPTRSRPHGSICRI